MEFNNAFQPTELTHLTPPQTPPQNSDLQKVKINFKNQLGLDVNNAYFQNDFVFTIDQQTHTEQLKSIVEQPTTQQFLTIYEQAINLVQAPDIEREMQVVDDLVRARAAGLPNWADDDNSSDTGSSLSSNTSYSDSSSSNVCDDEDWSPSSSPRKKDRLHELSNSNDSIVRKKRAYGRSVEDRSHRKKEQNKNAANRYRMKKKFEIEIILDEEKDLIKKNDELETQFSDIKREIKYLKGLMRELFVMKGMLK